MVNILRRIPARYLRQKYTDDPFCNEIMLLPYYIACLNIEHAYYERSGEYLPFEGACFADTLDMAENVAKSSGGEHIVAQNLMKMTEANTARVERQQAADIVVVMGNPPYNVGQENENDKNQNRKYPVLDARIRNTYVKDSQATLRNKLYDAYVRFFRWGSDRLSGRSGVVCFVSNNSFVRKLTFDGMRRELVKEFDAIYHIDLGGDARDGGGGNVFGIRVGVGITLLIRKRGTPAADPGHVYYYQLPDATTGREKLKALAQLNSVTQMSWRELIPDGKFSWLSDGLQSDYDDYMPIGTKDVKSGAAMEETAIFRLYSLGVVTNRDRHVYSFDARQVTKQAQAFVEIYNRAVDAIRRPGPAVNSEELVDVTDGHIKWTRQVKASLERGEYSRFDASHVRRALYRPFTSMSLYFDAFWNEETYQQPLMFPTPASEADNVVSCAPGVGDRKGFGTLASNTIPGLDLAFEKAQCFPYYVYDEDGSNRRENITDWALAQFREAYGLEVTKWDILHYVYGLLHHPAYRERYAENLKRELPRIPLVEGAAALQRCAAIGQRLMDLHLTYEKQPEYSLRLVEHPEGSPDGRVTFHVKKMKLSPDRTALLVNETLTLEGIPPACFEYRLGNRSALDWVIDQYQVSEDKRSGIASDPNRPDDPQYIVRLVGQVVTVSVETVRLVNDLAQTVLLPHASEAQPATSVISPTDSNIA